MKKYYYMLLSAFTVALSAVSCRDQATEDIAEVSLQKTAEPLQKPCKEQKSELAAYREEDHSDKGDDMPKK